MSNRDDSCLMCGFPLAECTCDNTMGYSVYHIWCPYCGEKQQQRKMSGLMENGKTTRYCHACSKDFILETFMAPTWTTKRMKQ